ncbi:MAG: hypothetical protein E7675_05230 [Ruminococcaceae bacterium]|nr:hypothetical protein [Oscillospiraceae bacterium]
MKKILCLVLSMIFVFSLFSCTPHPDDTDMTTGTATPPATIDIISSEKLNEFTNFIKNNLKTGDNGNISFLHLAKDLSCNGKIISESCSPQKNEAHNISSISLNGGSLFSFSESFKILSNGTVICSTDFFITEYVKSLELPFDITFEDSFEDVITKISDINLSMDKKHGSDVYLYKSEGKKLYLEQYDESDPLKLIYICDDYYTNEDGKSISRTEEMAFFFDANDKEFLSLNVKVEEKYKIPVSEIPVPTPTPLPPSPTPTPEVTGIFYDSKLSIAPYLDPDHTNPNKLFENSLNKPTDNRTLPIYVCDTFEDFDKFRRSFYGDINYDEKVESVYVNENIYSFVNNTMEYREDFFKEKSLILVYKRAGSGTNRYGSKCVTFNGSSLCVYVERTDNNLLGTDDVASWFISIEIDDKDLEGIKNFDARFYGDRW